MKLPNEPDRDRILELLQKTYGTSNTPDWNTAEQQEMFESLSALAFLWFRSEEFIIK